MAPSTRGLSPTVSVELLSQESLIPTLESLKINKNSSTKVKIIHRSVVRVMRLNADASVIAIFEVYYRTHRWWYTRVEVLRLYTKNKTFKTESCTSIVRTNRKLSERRICTLYCSCTHRTLKNRFPLKITVRKVFFRNPNKLYV